MQINIEERKSISHPNGRCYTGDDYDGYIMRTVEGQVMERFNCTTPYFPRQYRKGHPICQNTTVGRRVYNFIK